MNFGQFLFYLLVKGRFPWPQVIEKEGQGPPFVCILPSLEECFRHILL